MTPYSYSLFYLFKVILKKSIKIHDYLRKKCFIYNDIKFVYN